MQFTTRDAVRPVARYGRSPRARDYTSPAHSATYSAADMCDAPATTLGFISPGMLHTAALSGLEPGVQYWYQVGDAASGSFSAVYSFRAPPLPGADQTVHILTLADQGVGRAR